VPEGLEVERYRLAAELLAGRTIAAVVVADPLVVVDAARTVLPGCHIEAAGRIGKLLLLDTDGPVVGIHFGMTGRLVVDGVAGIDQLVYGSRRDAARWDRFVVRLHDGGSFRLHDPRRLGRVVLDPDVSRLGPDALAVSRGALAAALAGRRAPVKAVLLDQRRIAGLGNLLVDELLWWAGVDPRRPGGDMGVEEIAALHRMMRRRLRVMMRRGGSHTGVLSPAVRTGLHGCPRDGADLRRSTVGGRTTIWCPVHQV
jgi:formamidopyrimidine-DNA glycosylase